MARCVRFLFLLLVLAGCATPPDEHPREFVATTAKPVVLPPPAIDLPKTIARPVPAAPTNVVVMPPRTNPPLIARPNPLVPTNAIVAAPPTAPALKPPPSKPAPAFDYSTALIPLERWGQFIGTGPPQRFVNNGVVEYSFNSTNGILTIPIGGKIAHWNGSEYFLGFAPQMVNGHPYAHLLDVKKNLSPLLEGSSARFPTNRIVVIDPGHGGMDSGTANVFDGRFEKDFTLDWARRVQARLSANGWTVWLTRSNDVNLPLPARIAVADQHRAGLFVSLHFNSASANRKETGLETYCLTPTGMTSDFNRGYHDDPNLIYPNNSFDVQNFLVATRMHRDLLAVNGHLDRGVRRARFLGVLQGQNRPAVLVEGGYLSSPTEARRIADPLYRDRLAQAVAQSIMDGMRTDLRLASQSPTVSHNPGKVN